MAGKPGRVEALPPVAFKTEGEARSRVARLGETCQGVIGFARSADVEAAVYADPVILKRIGAVAEAGKRATVGGSATLRCKVDGS